MSELDRLLGLIDAFPVGALLSDHPTIATAVDAYVKSLDDHDRRNLLALVDLNAPEKLDAMAGQARAAGNTAGAAFTRVAAFARRLRDLAASAQTSEPVPPRAAGASDAFEIPGAPVTGARYALAMALAKGLPLKLTLVSGWVVTGKRPADNVYMDAAVVTGMLAEGLLVPAIGQPWDAPKEVLMSATLRRGVGLVPPRDRTAEVERRVYEFAGTPHDNDYARRYRSATADYRARQDKKDAAPGWNRWSEFEVDVPAHRDHGPAFAVRVLFECGRMVLGGHAPDCFELWAPELNARGYLQHTQAMGAVTNGSTVAMHAQALARQAAKRYRAEREHEERVERAAKKVKPKPPPLAVLDDGDDELARALGIL